MEEIHYNRAYRKHNEIDFKKMCSTIPKLVDRFIPIPLSLVQAKNFKIDVLESWSYSFKKMTMSFTRTVDVNAKGNLTNLAN